MATAIVPARTRAIEYVRVLAPAALLLAAAALLQRYAPGSLHLPECPFHAVTGFYCPGCGSTRALHHLLNLELLTALRCNCLAVVALPFVLAHFAVSGARRLGWLRGKLALYQLDMPPTAITVLVAVVLVWTVVRNLPFAIFIIPAQ